MRIAVSIILAFACVACAHDVRAQFPTEPGEPTGMLVVKLASPAHDVSLAIDGLLVLEDAHTGHVRVDGVPVGTRDIAITLNGVDKQQRVWVGSDHPTTVLVGVPDEEVGFVKTVLGTILTLVMYSLLFH
jgi:hypothetical protein